MVKTIDDINEKIRKGEAVVYTAQELKDMLRGGERPTPQSVDVVTTGTCGIMSGTSAVFTIPVAQKGSFKKARSLWLNGVPAYPGPCPNESLGVVDVIFYGTSYANNKYGGGHLLRDLVNGDEVEVRVESFENKTYENTITLDDFHFSRLITTRSCFRNYVSFLNNRNESFDTIFSVTGLKGPNKEISISGCGEINPLENDPALNVVGSGTKILLNGGVGYVMGQGTRSSREKPNLMAWGEMKGMDPQYMGGFKTSATPEVISSLAIPIPFTEQTMDHLFVTDEQAKLPVADIHDRVPFATSDYGCVWQGTDYDIIYDVNKCKECDECQAEKYCPTDAITPKKGIDKRKCFNCGACVFTCPNNAYVGNLGAMRFDDSKVPIGLRQSNRSRANKLCNKLKNMIIDKEFYLTKKVGDI